MKKLFLILMFCRLCQAAIVGLYVIHRDSFPPVALQNMFQYAVERSVDFAQSASMVEWTSAVSSTTAGRGLINRTWRDGKPVTDWRTSEIFMKCDIRIEGFHPIENFLAQGKITKVGAYGYDRHGFCRDRDNPLNIYTAAAVRTAWCNRWKFEVEVSSG